MSAHGYLRDATSIMHETLEHELDLSLLAQPAMYRRYLLMNWACASIEPGLQHAGIERLLPDWPARTRTAALAADLRALGIARPGAPIIRIDGGTGSLLGWAYVLEGSRLGARLILRTVSNSQDRHVSSATAFLSHGEGRFFWRSFLAVLSCIDGDGPTLTLAATAPRAAFQVFVQAANPPPPAVSL
jgi:heme oxygenase